MCFYSMAQLLQGYALGTLPPTCSSHMHQCQGEIILLITITHHSLSVSGKKSHFSVSERGELIFTNGIMGTGGAAGHTRSLYATPPPPRGFEG